MFLNKFFFAKMLSEKTFLSLLCRFDKAVKPYVHSGFYELHSYSFLTDSIGNYPLYRFIWSISICSSYGLSEVSLSSHPHLVNDVLSVLHRLYTTWSVPVSYS